MQKCCGFLAYKWWHVDRKCSNVKQNYNIQWAGKAEQRHCSVPSFAATFPPDLSAPHCRVLVTNSQQQSQNIRDLWRLSNPKIFSIRNIQDVRNDYKVSRVQPSPASVWFLFRPQDLLSCMKSVGMNPSEQATCHTIHKQDPGDEKGKGFVGLVVE